MTLKFGTVRSTVHAPRCGSY